MMVKKSCKKLSKMRSSQNNQFNARFKNIVIKPIKKRPIVFMILILFCWRVIAPAGRNFDGYCTDIGRYLTDNERIEIAIRDYVLDGHSRAVFSHTVKDDGSGGDYMKIEKSEKVLLSEQSFNKTFKGGYVKEYLKLVSKNYQTFEEFLEDNPNCCRVRHLFRGSSAFQSGDFISNLGFFLNRISGYNSGIAVMIKYSGKYISESGKEIIVDTRFLKVQSNCAKNRDKYNEYLPSGINTNIGNIYVGDWSDKLWDY